MKIRYIKSWIVAWMFLPMLTHAAEPQWSLVADKSYITFTATQNDAPVSGTFKKFTGTFHVNFNDLPNSSMHVVVDIASLSTSYEQIQTTLLSPDWFDVAKYPTAQFKSTKFSKVGENSYAVTGVLTIRDKSEPVKLTFTAEVKPPNNGVFVGQTMIKRSVFGVGQGEWASVDTVKDDVTIKFKVVATKP